MLLSLHIENVAVIKNTDIDFSGGFMALTGETGAGKSIILGSIALLLGERAERELIRGGEDCMMVSGLFGELTEGELSHLRECGVSADEEGNLLVQRTVTRDGRSQIKINGRAVSLSLLKAVTGRLVSIHGQSDTGELVNSSAHIGLLDTYASLSGLKDEYRVFYREYESIKAQIKDITEKESQRERLREMLEYQIRDIDSLALVDGEEEALVEKKVKIRNSEKITKNSEFVFKALKGSEKGSVSFLLDRSINALSQISGVIPAAAEFSERLRDMLYQVDDIAEEVYAVIEDTEENPTEALNKIESRLEKISRLKRKYGLTIKDILEFRARARAELDTLENSEELLLHLEKERERLYKKAVELAERLHERRVLCAAELENKIKDTLEFLDMPKVVFFISIKEGYEGENKRLGADGFDEVEFYISANRGAEAQSISKIASGGELARIMLALKSVIADKDGVKTVIFDEIDTGVSGKTARKIGIKMLSLSKSAQLLCVTHSAQIASLADRHYLISKGDVNGATETKVKELDYEGRASELSRILGGIDVTDSQRAAAVDMLDERRKYI